MWLDRFSGHSTPSGSPPPHSRNLPPDPRRPSHLAPGPTGRPAFSPRSSSLAVNLSSNASTASLLSEPRLANGSSQKQGLPPHTDVADPLIVLEQIVGSPLVREIRHNGYHDESRSTEKPEDLVEDIDFSHLSLYEFARTTFATHESGQVNGQPTSAPSVEEYEKEEAEFEDLHRSILACDEVLKSVEASLTSFQQDLGTVSAEIETLQSRSTAINTRLENRKRVEKLLGPMVEELSISPAVVRKISEETVDENWIKALEDLEKRSNIIDIKSKGAEKSMAVTDVKPLLDDLKTKAVERIRDFFIVQVKALRSPSINAQIIQQQFFLKFKDIFAFLVKHHAQLAEEIGQAYINTMRWYYLDHFTRYRQALDRIHLFTVDRNEGLAADQAGHKGTSTQRPHDAINIGRRMDVLKPSSQPAITSYLAEESKATQYLEVPFRNFNLALVDNASSEYSFLTEFFASNSFHQVARKFTAVFEPTFALGQALTKDLIDGTYDCLGILICIRLNQHSAFELQRRKIPVADGYINGTNLLLWPRFQVAMDMHCESVRRAVASISGRSAVSALSLMGSADAAKQSTAPHYLTQRFSQFLQGILVLSSEAGDDEPVSNSLSRLRAEFEVFLTKMGKGIGDPKKRERFLFNNYSLVLTIIGDAVGKLAQEQREHFEALKEVFEKS